MTVQSQVYRRTIENVNLEGFLFLWIWMGLRSLVISFRVDRWSRAKTRAKVSDLPLIVTLQTIFCSSFLFFFFLPFSFLPFLFVLFFLFFFLTFHCSSFLRTPDATSASAEEFSLLDPIQFNKGTNKLRRIQQRFLWNAIFPIHSLMG